MLNILWQDKVGIHVVLLVRRTQLFDQLTHAVALDHVLQRKEQLGRLAYQPLPKHSFGHKA